MTVKYKLIYSPFTFNQAKPMVGMVGMNQLRFLPMLNPKIHNDLEAKNKDE